MLPTKRSLTLETKPLRKPRRLQVVPPELELPETLSRRSKMLPRH